MPTGGRCDTTTGTAMATGNMLIGTVHGAIGWLTTRCRRLGQRLGRRRDDGPELSSRNLGTSDDRKQAIRAERDAVMSRSLNHRALIDGLQELESESEQEWLWLSDGSNGYWSCLEEAYYGLFDDSTFAYQVESGETELGAHIDSMLRDLDDVLMEVDGNRPPEQVIADPKMKTVRAMASRTLSEVMAAGARNRERIIGRVLELSDEKRQRSFWIPAGGGLEARSSLWEVNWHLFTGEDFWRYLDVGDRPIWRDVGDSGPELFAMFSQLEKLVLDLDPYGYRTSGELIADPKMVPVRRMAARIIEKL